jgi:hypothetical protein
MYNTEVSLTSQLKTGGAGSKIGTVFEKNHHGFAL